MPTFGYQAQPVRRRPALLPDAPRPALQQEGVGAAIAQAGEQAVQAVLRYDEHQKRKERNAAEIEATEWFTLLGQDERAMQMELGKRQGLDANGASQFALDWYKGKDEELRKVLGGQPDMLAAARQKLWNSANSSISRVDSHETRELGAARRQALDLSNQERLQQVAFYAADDEKFAALSDEALHGFRAEYGPEQGALEFVKWRDQAVAMRVREIAVSDAKAGRAKLDELREITTAGTFDRLRDEMEREIKAEERERKAEERARQHEERLRQAEMKYSLSAELDDEAASAMITGRTGPDADRKLAQLAAIDPKAAASVRRKIGIGREFHAVLVETNGLPFREQMDRIRDLMPEAGAPAFRERMEVYQRAAETVARREREFSADPAQAVSGEVAARAAQAGVDPSDPASVPRIVEASIARQRELGAVFPRVLTSQQAAEIKDRYERGGGMEKISILREFEAFGPYQAQAMRESGIGASAQILAHASKVPGVRASDMETWAESQGTQPEWTLGEVERRELRQEANAKLAESRLGEAILGLAASLPQNTMLQQIAGEMRKTAENFTLRTRSPERLSEFLDSAFDGFFDEEVGAIFWKRTDPVPFDVSSRLQKARADMPESFLAWQGRALKGAYGEEVGARMFEERLSDLRQRGLWINAPDGNGFVLTDMDGQLVADESGNAFRLTFRDLAAMSVDRPIEDSLMWGGT